MIHAYFEYMTAEYPADAGHGMLLVQLHGPDAGQPWAPAGVRGMLRRAGIREEMGRIRPHQCRHWFTTSVLDGAGGNAVIARDAADGRRPQRWSRSTGTRASTARCSRPRSRMSGARRREPSPGRAADRRPGPGRT
jgi:hypothetical protein